MLKRRWVVGGFSVIVFLLGFSLGSVMHLGNVQAQAAKRVFEIRTYTATPGSLQTLSNRFRDHTMRIFERHGITNIGYFVPQGSDNQLVYILAYPSREAADKSWTAFRADPERAKVFADSEVNGKLIETIGESLWVEPTDYSPMK